MKTRKALYASLLTAALTLSGSADAAEPAKTPRPQAVRSITVKVMPAGLVARGSWKISTLTAKSCTVQIDARDGDDGDVLRGAFFACVQAKPERPGCRTLTFEDGTKARAVVGKDGTWDQAGCDQRLLR